MRREFRICVLGLLIGLVFMACQSNDSKTSTTVYKSQPESTPKTEVSRKPSSAHTIVIYDQLKNGNMAYREVSFGQTKKDPVRDAIGAYIDQSQLAGDYRNLSLHRIGMINRKANFAFAGTVKFENDSQQKRFRQALDSTIVHHFKNKNYTVSLNGEAW